MKKIYFLIIALTVLAISGCASPPTLAPMMLMPSIPADTSELIEVELTFDNKIGVDAVQLESHKVKKGSTIVINVPANLFKYKSDKSASAQDFKTKDFFNAAEQQIEKVLIRNGFRVLSRSRFEAKLRTMRDESRCNINEYRCLYSRVDPDIKPILESLKKQFENGKIDAIRYAKEIKLIKDDMTVSSAGRNRTNDTQELTDISEIIRAAESGAVQSDYVLQINKFDTKRISTVESNLLHLPAVRAFIRDNPAIKSEFENNKIITCTAVGAHLNAKLIHVKTGEIAWIGEHELNEFSSGAQTLIIEFGIRKYVSNTNDISDFVNRQNGYIERIKRYGKKIKNLSPKYSEALIIPVVSSGRCERNAQATNKERMKSARTVAKELINTIKIN